MVAIVAKNGRFFKGRRMGRARVEPDLTSYSGRVAARVRALRDKHGMSVEKLAAKLGISEQTMYGYENGKRTIPPDLYPAIAAVFGVTVRALLPNE